MLKTKPDSERARRVNNLAKTLDDFHFAGKYASMR
jgi:hypothetical protein